MEYSLLIKITIVENDTGTYIFSNTFLFCKNTIMSAYHLFAMARSLVEFCTKALFHKNGQLQLRFYIVVHGGCF